MAMTIQSRRRRMRRRRTRRTRFAWSIIRPPDPKEKGQDSGLWQVHEAPWEAAVPRAVVKTALPFAAVPPVGDVAMNIHDEGDSFDEFEKEQRASHFPEAARARPCEWPRPPLCGAGAPGHNQLDNAPRDIGTERHPKRLAADTGFVEHVVPRGLPVCLEQLCVSWPT